MEIQSLQHLDQEIRDGLNIFYSIEKDWVWRNIRHYPLQISELENTDWYYMLSGLFLHRTNQWIHRHIKQSIKQSSISTYVGKQTFWWLWLSEGPLLYIFAPLCRILIRTSIDSGWRKDHWGPPHTSHCRYRHACSWDYILCQAKQSLVELIKQKKET